jgi:hypothetical protein
VFRYLLPRTGNVIFLTCLVFGLNLVLTTTALGKETDLVSTANLWDQPPIPQAQSNTPQAFILLTSNNTSQLAQVKALIEAERGRVVHTFSQQAIIAKIPAGLEQQLATLPGVALAVTQPVELSTVDVYGPEARRYAGVWNSLITPPSENSELGLMTAEHPAEELPDAFIAPDLPTGDGLGVASTSVTPGYYQTSDYMAGSVAVGIILVESDGSVDPSTENWATDEKQLVFNEIVAALNWWTNLEPRANLSFVYDDHFSHPLPTGVEPITRPYYHQQYWISDAMGTLGYTAWSYFTRVRDYNNALRAAYQTDWAFTIFVVDSSADSDNRFSDGYFAYAYLGGPFTVLTYGNNGYGPYNMDAVAAHEIGHIFHALDQYYSAYQPCTQRAGYLYVENQNSQYGSCSSNVASIMRGQTYPYYAHAIDVYGAGQIGWRDSDGDNILDPLDTDLPISIDTLSQNGDTVTVSGATEIIPYPSPSRTSVTINTLTGVQYRFNGGDWQPATATDGTFDSTTESYHFTVTSLPPGLHKMEVAALDTAGNVSDVYATETIAIFDPIDGGLNTELYLPGHPFPTGTPITLNGVAYHLEGGVVANVQYRFGGDLLQPANAQDGAFDSDYETFSLTFGSLEVGSYQLEVFATDGDGHTEVNAVHVEFQVAEIPTYQIFLPVMMK